MMEWMRAYDQRDWIAVENWWRHSDDIEAKQALFDQLRRDCPKQRLVNGTDVEEVPLPSKDVAPEWRGAVEMLELGELEASLEADPPSSAAIWADQHSALVSELQTLAASPEVTEGDDELSRASHARHALEALDQIEQEISFYLNLFEPDEREVLKEFAARLALNALRAGHFAHAAGSKAAQAHAVRGQKTLSSAKAGGEARARQTRQRTQEARAEMYRLIDKGFSMKRAAELAAEHGFGTSANANRELLKRDQQKK